MVSSVIRFTAKWCGPCKMFAPIFEKASQEEKFKDIEFRVVDVDEDESGEAEKYAIRNIPTVVMLDQDGRVYHKIIGAVPLSELVSLLEEGLN